MGCCQSSREKSSASAKKEHQHELRKSISLRKSKSKREAKLELRDNGKSDIDAEPNSLKSQSTIKLKKMPTITAEKEKDGEKEPKSQNLDDGTISENDQKGDIHEQFQAILDNDPEMRKKLANYDYGSRVDEITQIIEAYKQGGADAFEIETEYDEEDQAALETLQKMTPEEKAQIEASFEKLYATKPDLQSALGPIENLDLIEKYQTL